MGWIQRTYTPLKNIGKSFSLTSMKYFPMFLLFTGFVANGRQFLSFQIFQAASACKCSISRPFFTTAP